MRNRIQRLREGYDWTWWIIIGMLIVPVIAGVLENKELLNLIP